MKGLFGFAVSSVAQAGLAMVLLAGIAPVRAQQIGQMDHAKSAAASTKLTVNGLDGKTVRITIADLAVHF
ncbi:MAG: hypothetical protein WCA10_14030 [Terracidiphilus sp.]